MWKEITESYHALVNEIAICPIEVITEFLVRPQHVVAVIHPIARFSCVRVDNKQLGTMRLGEIELSGNGIHVSRFSFVELELDHFSMIRDLTLDVVVLDDQPLRSA